MSPKATAITPVTGKDRLLAGQAIKAPKKQPPAKPENHHKIVFNISLHLLFIHSQIPKLFKIFLKNVCKKDKK